MVKLASRPKDVSGPLTCLATVRRGFDPLHMAPYCVNGMEY